MDWTTRIPSSGSVNHRRFTQPTLFALKRCLNRTLLQQCAGHDGFGNSFGEVPKLNCTPNFQIEDAVLHLPKNNHSIESFDIKVFEKV